MSTALQSSLNGLLTPSFVDQTAKSLGETASSVSKAMSAIFPALIGSLGDHADDATFMSSVYDQVAAPENDPGILGNPARLLGKAAMALPSMLLGGKFLKMMFGPKVDELGHDLGDYAGVRETSAQSMLGIAAPLVLGALGKIVRAGNMNVTALARLLRGEAKEAHAALPGALSHLERYSSIPPSPALAQAYRVSDTRTQYFPAEEKKSTLWRWLLPLMLALAAAWLLSTFFTRSREPSEVMTAPATIDMEEMEITAPPQPEPERTQAAPVPVADETATEERKREAEPKARAVDVVTGDEVVVLEEQIIEGEVSKEASVDDSDAMEPELPEIPVANVYFDDESSALPANVEVRLIGIVSYMKANPGSTAMLSTYHSTADDSAKHKKRSAERADAVRDALVASGIAESRIRVLDPVEVTGAQPREDRVQVRVRP